MNKDQNFHSWDPKSGKVTIADLKEFLASSGWTTQGREESTLFLSQPDEEKNIVRILVPSESNNEYYYYVLRLLRAFAQVRELDVDQVVQMLREYIKDKVSAHQTTMRIKIGQDAETALELSEAEELVHHVRLALAHSLGCEINSYYAYRPRPTVQASEASQHFEFGQTQRGSFVFVIRASRHTADQPSFQGVEAGLADQTKSILRLARGLSWISSNDVPNQYDDAVAISQDGLNASMAKHLLDISNSVGGRPCSIFFDYSSDVPVDRRPSARDVALSPLVLSRLGELFRVLSNSGEMTLTIKAMIIKLHSKNPQQERMTHKITVEMLKNPEIEGLEHKKLTLMLDQAKYQKALKAHAEGRPIEITGIFRLVGDTIESQQVLTLNFPS